MFRLLKNLRPKDVALWLVAVALIAAQVWLELKMPDYMATITKLVQTEGSEMSDILSNGLKMVLCAFGSLISAIGVGYIISTVSATFSMRVRKKLFDKVEELSLNEVRKFSTSSLITRSTNDITQIQMLVSMGGQMLVRAPMTAAWAIVKISNKSWQWSTATAITVVF
jgi:ATP-binding cassette subfamily B protein